ncbi:hypothetical protein BDZ89DRAFT_1138687 [Hymenopellis radicata]|nr:hypothetical protein BDZ89DRAFT_1138687 [Hymenopellis radicata]
MSQAAAPGAPSFSKKLFHSFKILLKWTPYQTKSSQKYSVRSPTSLRPPASSARPPSLNAYILYGTYPGWRIQGLLHSPAHLYFPMSGAVISLPESDVGDLLLFDVLEALTLASLHSLDLHTLQEWPTVSTSAFFTGSTCRFNTLHLRLPHVTSHVLSVLVQCDGTLMDINLLGSSKFMDLL